MAKIPAAVAESSFSHVLIALGYPLLYRGKVGELYEVPGKPLQLLMLRSDRLSIFDFVLPCLVEQKGEVLIALTHYWLTQVFPDVPNHLLAWGRDRRWLAAGWKESDVVRLPLERILLIERGETWPYEMIFRAHIGGSVFEEYQQQGTACGQKLPLGMSKWQKLPGGPIFTPTTKAEGGHDIKVTVADYLTATHDLGRKLMDRDRQVYERAYVHASGRGILILDTKFENNNRGDLIDEVLTPDSSRFTTPQELEAAIAAGKDPPFYDKEPVRIWGRQVPTPWGVGLHRLDPENSEHLAFIEGLAIPEDIIAETRRRYLDIFERITGMSLRKYQETVMVVWAMD